MSSNELPVLTETVEGGPESARNGAMQRLIAALKQTVAAGQQAEAAAALRRVVSPLLDYTTAQALSQIHSRVRDVAGTPRAKVRLAVLGSFTTTQLVRLAELHLFALGIDAEVYVVDYGVFRQEILDPQSALYRFTPQFVWLATSWREVAQRPELHDDREQAERVVKSEVARWYTLWETLENRLHCQIIQDNFVLPAFPSFANHDLRHPGSLNRYLSELNRQLADRAPEYVTIHDVDYLASQWGRWVWNDARFFHHAKLPCAPECLVDYAHSLASLVAAQLGYTRKCLVLDLDGTLWGGAIGDDGLGGIRLGQGDPEGEAFLAFQTYLRNLRLRGVILAICSKNNAELAREPFEKHAEIVLRLSDIACFVANWDDKAANLRNIAATLNLGLDSLVFVDDNPAERALVRRCVPEVAVPELPDDVALYAQALDRQRYFQVVSLADEDFRRTDYYRADSLRRDFETSAGDLDAYLRSLEMTARIRPIDAGTLARSVQLIRRSNQFNLTTRRRSESELQALVGDAGWITRVVSLADRFGDHGLISVLLARIALDALEIDTWLMSCRVLKRGVEQLLLNHICRAARACGVLKIRGWYIPTAKNALVQKHYAVLGFTLAQTDSGGTTTWELPVLAAGQTCETTIAELPADGLA